jgi:hypothetical protein
MNRVVPGIRGGHTSNQPKTIYEALALLALDHRQRAKQYEHLRSNSTDSRAEILLDEHSLKAIQSEMNDLSPERSTHLIPEPELSPSAMHATESRCDGEPSCYDALECALTPISNWMNFKSGSKTVVSYSPWHD